MNVSRFLTNVSRFVVRPTLKKRMKSRVVEAVVMPLPTRDFDDRAGLGRAAADYVAASPSFDNLEYNVCLEMPSSRAARERFPPNFASASRSADF